MIEFVTVILTWGLGLFIWSAIGHLLWLLVGFFFKLIFGKSCPRCDCRHLGSKCPDCSKHALLNERLGKSTQPGVTQANLSPANLSQTPVAQTPSVQEDLAAAKRLLKFASFNRWLTEEQIAALDRLIGRLTARVQGIDAAPPVPKPLQTPTPPIINPVKPRVELKPVVMATPGPTITPPAMHPLDRPEEPAAVRIPRPPLQTRVTANLLKSFMEQSNIRWVELISAALIVVCSVGLVISLWNTLSSTSRFFPSLVFMLATIAVHGAGQYTLRQWKLRTTSRGILHIGLMLIPLAMLVGILLSRRDGGLPVLDLSTALVILTGAVIYSGLAITACKSLFSKRWPLVAAHTIVASLTLLPINYLSERKLLGELVASWSLLPLVLISLACALAISRSSPRLASGASGVARRTAGIVTQCLFSGGIVLVFWFLQVRNAEQLGSGLSVGWWIASGLLAAAWASWGWSVSIPTLLTSHEPTGELKSPAVVKQTSTSGSWLIVAAWFVATALSLFLLATVWQVAFTRPPLVVLLAAIAAWWLAQGWLCNLRVSLLAGAVSLLVALTLLVEHSWASAPTLGVVHWLSLSRIGTLSIVGAVACIVPLILRLQVLNEARTAPPRPFARQRTASLSDIGQQLQLAGGGLVAVAACLTIVASLLPVGETPYGGNWAAIMLMAYGVLGLVAGIALAQLQLKPQLFQFVVPLGQALLLLGVVRLCQTSPLLEDVLGSLRPMHSWSLGTAGLALLWAVIAAALRLLGDARQLRNIDWLAWFASSLSLVSAVALWTARDQFWLASSVGWCLPLTCLALFVGWRYAAWREITLLTLCLWVGSLIIFTGTRQEWWGPLGLAGSAAAIIGCLTLVVVAYELLIAPKPDWLAGGLHWGALALLSCGWLGLCLALSIPALQNISLSLGGNGQTQLHVFATQVLNPTGFGLSLAALLGLTAVSTWRSRQPESEWLLSATALAPVALAMALAAWFNPPYALAAALWGLASCILLSDLLLPWLGTNWQSRSVAAWKQLSAPSETFPQPDAWLVYGRGCASSLLVFGTVAYAIAGLTSGLLEAGTSTSTTWLTRLQPLLVTLGPVLLASAVRWWLCVWNAEAPALTAAAAMLTAFFAGVTAAMGLIDFAQPGSSHPWPAMAVVVLQTTALVSVVLAWLTLGFTGTRNFLGLQQMLRGKLAITEIASKAMKGSRWQRSEKASWSLVSFSRALVIVLTVAATWLVVTYPIQLAASADLMQRLGGSVVVFTVLLCLGLFAWLSTRRGAPKFGLLAINLGLIAPFGAAVYASRLISVGAPKAVMAHGFEPFRALIVLWLVALTVGLVVRLIATVHSRTFSQWGELAWVLLAIGVGSLAVVSTTQDPNWVWPLAELSALALITLLSGVFAQQPWRGHLAAVTAAIGIGAWWLDRGFTATALHEMWLVLWGPMWIGIVAIVARRVWANYQQVAATENENKRTGFRFSVEQSFSLLFPLTAALLSFVWLVSQHMGAGGPAWLLPSILGLSTCGLGLAIARLWEPLPGKRGLAVYLNVISLGLVGAMSLSAWEELPRLQSWLIWLASGLGAMAVMAGLLRELVRESSVLGPQLKLGSVTSRERYQHALRWMPIAHCVAAMLALVPCVLLVLALEERALRIAATVLPFLGAIAVLPIAMGQSRGVLRYCGLTLISTSLVLLWWADLPNAWAVTNLEGSWIFVQRSFVALVTLGCLYPLLAHWLRHKEEWLRPLMDMGWLALGLGSVTGLVMLAGSIGQQWDQVAESIDIGSKLMTIVAWIAVATRLLQFAARPHSTDQGAPIPLRKAAVFVAELAIALLSAATYYHFPHLFAGILIDWWPIVFFGVAMLSAGIGEWLRRLGEPILADPVQQSSLLLPIIPLVGVWIFRAETAQLQWDAWGRYALLLLSGAGLYGLHGWARNSVALRALSCLLTLGAFWSFLHSQPDLRFAEHPQFWLLPPALAALVFVEFNRQRLQDEVVVATRYISILVAYLSSTSEIFLKAFEGELWQPLLLLVLALAGVGAGIVLRVRAFLLCGAAFTMVALLGMVWHAQQAIGQVWPWWAFGIATGICLIVCLGYFEKNRPRVIAYLEQFRKWEN